MFAQIIVNLPGISGTFDYRILPELERQVEPGCLVEVPFGKQMVQGVVLSLSEESAISDTKYIVALLDSRPVVTPLQMQLAQRMSEQTLAPLAACVDFMLPPGLSQQADTLYSLGGQTQNPSEKRVTGFSAENLSGVEKRLLNLLEKRGPLRGRQVNAALSRLEWKSSSKSLVKKGLILARPVLPPPAVRPKFVRTARIACSPAELSVYMVQQKDSATSRRRSAVLRYLLEEPLPVAVQWVYAASGATLPDLKELAELDLIQLSESEVWRDPLENIIPPPAEMPLLTHEQQEAWDKIRSSLEKANTGSHPPPILLYGVTGSGKTEIYLRAVQETLAQGRQAIILVPEIALTPQTVRRFMARFPGRVGLVHSRLSPGERYDTWRRARAGALPVIVGPRSALFTPLHNLGLIVVDECHEESYYQDDIQPFYNAVDLAREYAHKAGAVVVYGSATPDVSMLFRARSSGWMELHLPYRMLAHVQTIANQQEKLGLAMPTLPQEGAAALLPLPPVEVVDMREELKAGNRSLFSRSMQEALATTLEAHQQAILYLNRRGDSTYMFCRSCGYSLRCPRCDSPLTLHNEQAALICHRCNYQRQIPRTCPQCGSTQFRQYGAGTEKVEKEATLLFPNARILRWDADTTKGKDAHEILLSHFANQRADVLIGTKMLAKGLDLPLVTLVGMILGDVGLNLPDFRAGERTFQLMTQVAGRAGRSPLGGKAILQTFQPEHYVIRAVAGHDFERFYETELGYRREMGYPPFTHLLRLEFRHAKAERAEEEAKALAQQVNRWLEAGNFVATDMIGPAPCFFNRRAGEFRWQIILRGPDPAAVMRGKPLGGWRVEIDPPEVL